MSQVVKDAIATNTEALVQVMAAPEVVGYGSDLKALDDIDDNATETDPNTNASLVQDVYHRVTTDRQTIIDDPDFGISLFGFLNRGAAQREILAMAGQLRAEILKDDRVDDVDVTVTQSSLSRLDVKIDVTPLEPTEESFELLLAVTDGGVLLEEIREAA